MSNLDAPTAASSPKVLLATFGTLGDIHPFIGLAHGLRARGLAPVIATSAMHRAVIESEGLAFAPIRPDEPDIASALGLDVAGVLKRVVSDPHFILDEIYLRFLEATYEDVLDASRDADVIVAHSLFLGAQLAAEASGRTWIRVALAPIHLQSALAPALTRPLPYRLAPQTALARGFNRVLREILRRSLDVKLRRYHLFRRGLDLAPARDAYISCGRPSGPGTLVGLYSPQFAGLAADHPPDARLTGFPFYRAMAPTHMTLEPDVEAFLDDGPPPIVFTLGSFAVEGAGGFYEAGIAAARRLGSRSLALVGARDGERLAALAGPDVLACSYAPHALVFPRARLVVHHGGMGTTAEALRAGKPQLVVPFFGDQPDNAVRLHRLGVARVVAPRAFDTASAADGLAALMSVGTETRVEALARTIAAEDGITTFADFVAARLAAHPQRVPV